MDQEFLQSCSTNRVKSFCQVRKDQVEVLVLFPTFLLELAHSKDHVDHAPDLLKAALTFRVHLLSSCVDSVDDHSREDFACDAQQQYSSVIVTVGSVTFSFIKVDYCCILKVLRHNFSLPDGAE